MNYSECLFYIISWLNVVGCSFAFAWCGVYFINHRRIPKADQRVVSTFLLMDVLMAFAQVHALNNGPTFTQIWLSKIVGTLCFITLILYTKSLKEHE